MKQGFEFLQQRFVGGLVAYDRETGMAEVEVKNKFAVGDKLELILPGGNRTFRLAEMFDLDGRRMREAPGGGYRVRIPVEGGNLHMGLLARLL